MLELHCHTTFSDGTLTPAELVGAAASAGVRALAITDHDTLRGWDEAQAAAATLKADLGVELEIVPGVELSTVCNDRSLHILGFYPDRSKLEAPLQERLTGRWRRAQAMAARLAALGYPIVLPSLAAGMAPGRPHLAQALVAAGHASTTREAFARWLHDDGPAYVRYEKFSAVAGIQLLLASGGVPVWAHPYLFRGGEVEAILPELVAAGLGGIEVYHPNHTPSQQRQLLQLAQNYGLLATGGSDYHGPAVGGTNSPGNGECDRALNGLQVPLELLAPLKAAKEALDSNLDRS